MKIPKIIFIDGITGSGKSTTSSFITRQLKKNGIKTKCPTEHDEVHLLAGIDEIKNETEGDVNMCDNYPFCINRNLKGEDAYVVLHQETTSICLEVFEDILFKKLKIENSAHDWKTYRQQILDFIGIPLIEEELFDPSYEEYCGYYSGYPVHIRNNRLCIDQYNNNLKLIKTGEDEFQIESENVTYKFLRSKEGKVESIQITSEYRSKHIGLIYKKYDALSLSTEKMLSYCGHYLCEDKNTSCEIILEDGILYNMGEYGKRIMVAENDLKFNLKYTTLEIVFDDDGSYNNLLYHNPLGKDMQFKRFDPQKLNNHDLLPFCGEYWCEADRLERKIYFREGVLFYWRSENSESILLPDSKTQLKMMVEVDNTVDFELVKGEWQFTFDVKGDNPSKSLFVRKK